MQGFTCQRMVQIDGDVRIGNCYNLSSYFVPHAVHHGDYVSFKNHAFVYLSVHFEDRAFQRNYAFVVVGPVSVFVAYGKVEAVTGL